MANNTWDVIVVGGGVLGSFHAYFAAKTGLRTLLIDRGRAPAGASVRNFGLIVPSAMTVGEWHDRGVESAVIYRELASEIGFDLQTRGTQFVASNVLERAVATEFAEVGPRHGYTCQFLDENASRKLNPAIRSEYCCGSLYFPDDLRFEPGAFFRQFLPWLSSRFKCAFSAETHVVEVSVGSDSCSVKTATGECHIASHVFLCTGSDLETLLPTVFESSGLEYCKLQMFRTAGNVDETLTTHLASGLSLRRYESFSLSPSWHKLQDAPIDDEIARNGIHVLVVQNSDGGVVVGDSHQYSSSPPNDWLEVSIEDAILREAQRMVLLPSWDISARWHGVFTLHADEPLFRSVHERRVHIVTGIGGKGMTTGPAVARESIAQLF